MMDLDKVLNTKQLLKKAVASLIPISDFLEEGRKMFECPFHMDSNPSAKLFEDKDCERLFCFSCRRNYTSFDYLEKVLNQDPKSYLLSRFSTKTLSNLIQEVDFSYDRIEFNFDPYKEHLPDLDKFLVSIFRPELMEDE